MAAKELLGIMWFRGSPESQHMLRAATSHPKQI